MPARPAPFSQTDLTRALKGFLAAGIPVGRVDFPPEGGFKIFAANDNAGDGVTGANPCDRLLKGGRR